MAQRVAIPIKDKPGHLFIPSLNQTISQNELKQDDLYDTVEFVSGSQAAGTEQTLFDNRTNKKLQHTNLKRDNQIGSHQELAILRVGASVTQALGNTVVSGQDIKKAAWGAYLQLEVNERRVAEGPLAKFGSGYGAAGSTSENDESVVTIGVASVAASPLLLVPQPVNDNDQLTGKVVFGGRGWVTNAAQPSLATDLGVSIFLHGVFKIPVGA